MDPSQVRTQILTDHGVLRGLRGVLSANLLRDDPITDDQSSG